MANMTFSICCRQSWQGHARILRGGCWTLSCRWCRYSLLGMRRWCRRASHLESNLIDRPKILKARPADLDWMTSAQPTSWHILSFSRIYIYYPHNDILSIARDVYTTTIPFLLVKTPTATTTRPSYITPSKATNSIAPL